jgi:hypothetical protein
MRVLSWRKRRGTAVSLEMQKDLRMQPIDEE